VFMAYKGGGPGRCGCCSAAGGGAAGCLLGRGRPHPMLTPRTPVNPLNCRSCSQPPIMSTRPGAACTTHCTAGAGMARQLKNIQQQLIQDF
jgi:hypothetical protein